MLTRKSDGSITGGVPYPWGAILAGLGWMAWGWPGVFYAAATFLAANLVLTGIAIYGAAKISQKKEASDER